MLKIEKKNKKERLKLFSTDFLKWVPRRKRLSFPHDVECRISHQKNADGN